MNSEWSQESSNHRNQEIECKRIVADNSPRPPLQNPPTNSSGGSSSLLSKFDNSLQGISVEKRAHSEDDVIGRSQCKKNQCQEIRRKYNALLEEMKSGKD